MNKKPDNFEEAYSQYVNLIKKQLKHLRIYKHHDDYFQTGLIALWEAYSSYDEAKGSFSNHAFQTIRGKILTKMRSEHRYEDRHKPSETLEVFNQTYEPDLLEKEIIVDYCQHLAPNQQKVIIGKFYEEKSFAQIAEDEGVKLATVRSWYRYACENLRKQLEDGHSDGNH